MVSIAAASKLTVIIAILSKLAITYTGKCNLTVTTGTIAPNATVATFVCIAYQLHDFFIINSFPDILGAEYDYCNCLHSLLVLIMLLPELWLLQPQ